PCDWRLRIGGTFGNPDGTEICTGTVSDANSNLDVVTGSGSFANPGGVILVKLTGEGMGSSYSFQYATITFRA
ncbi:hypothetical protein, partial [Enterococcus casseliflavus]|uniref:hypothetical protein n=1 Tax=Enterococcus casseliflavus TaxID=37734 RepID=UPI003D101CFE